MAINIVGAVAVVSVYWAIWYAVGTFRRKANAGNDAALKWLWRFNAAALLGSGACFVAAGLLNRPDNASSGVGVDRAQMIAVLVIVLVLGTFGVVGIRRTARVKAAEVAAAKIPSGYTVQTEARRQPASYVPSFASQRGATKADSIIEEIKAGSW